MRTGLILHAVISVHKFIPMSAADTSSIANMSSAMFNIWARAPDQPVPCSIRRLSDDLILNVADYLSDAQSACLFLTCKRFYTLSGCRRWRHIFSASVGAENEDGVPTPPPSSSWGTNSSSDSFGNSAVRDNQAFLAAQGAAETSPPSPARTDHADPDKDRLEFLRLLQRDMPDHFACFMGCGTLHRFDALRDRAFGCRPHPRDCEVLGCSVYIAGYAAFLVALVSLRYLAWRMQLSLSQGFSAP